MADYCSIDDVRAVWRMGGDDVDDDARIASAITLACDMIDKRLGNTGRATNVPEALRAAAIRATINAFDAMSGTSTVADPNAPAMRPSRIVDRGVLEMLDSVRSWWDVEWV